MGEVGNENGSDNLAKHRVDDTLIFHIHKKSKAKF